MEAENEINARIKLFRRRLKDLIDMTSERTKKTEAKQAQEMGTKKNNLSRYCSDIDADKERPIPRIDQLVRFANYYNVSTDYLLGYTDAEQPVTTDEGRLIRAICDYTGLSEEAVKHLHDGFDNYLQVKIIPEVINTIICTSAEQGDIHWLINDLYAYLNSDNALLAPHIQPEGNSIILKDGIVNNLIYLVYGEAGGYTASTTVDSDFLESFFMLRVENGLRKVKQKYNENMSKK